MSSFFLSNWSPPDDPARPLPAEGRPWPSDDDDDDDDDDDGDGVRIGGIGVRSEVGSINVKPVAIGSRVSGRTKHSARLPDQMCKRTTSNIGPGFVIMHQFFYK